MTTEAEPKPRVFQKGYLPAEVTRHNSDIEVHVNRFPLGDAENFSVARAAHAIAREKRGMTHDTAWQVAKWEKQYLLALREVKANGDQVSGIDGGYLAPELWSDRFFGVLRSFTIFDKLSVARINVPARVAHLPKVTNDLSVQYPGENGAIATSSFQFGEARYAAHKATALINVSNELLGDAPEAADQILRQEGARFIAWDRDNQLLNGQGGPNPTGLLTMAAAGTISKYYTPGTSTGTLGTGASHGTPSLYHLSQLRSKVTSLNGSTAIAAGQAKCDGIVMHSRFEQTVHTMAAAASPWTDAQGRPFWTIGLEAGDGLIGVKNWPLTNMLPTASTDGGGTASSFAIAGWWQMYCLFECLTLGFDASPEADGFNRDQTQIRLIHRYDGAPAVPQAFAVLAGVDQ